MSKDQDRGMTLEMAPSAIPTSAPESAPEVAPESAPTSSEIAPAQDRIPETSSMAPVTALNAPALVSSCSTPNPSIAPKKSFPSHSVRDHPYPTPPRRAELAPEAQITTLGAPQASIAPESTPDVPRAPESISEAPRAPESLSGASGAALCAPGPLQPYHNPRAWTWSNGVRLPLEDAPPGQSEWPPRFRGDQSTMPQYFTDGWPTDQPRPPTGAYSEESMLATQNNARMAMRAGYAAERAAEEAAGLPAGYFRSRYPIPFVTNRPPFRLPITLPTRTPAPNKFEIECRRKYGHKAYEMYREECWPVEDVEFEQKQREQIEKWKCDGLVVDDAYEENRLNQLMTVRTHIQNLHRQNWIKWEAGRLRDGRPSPYTLDQSKRNISDIRKELPKFLKRDKIESQIEQRRDEAESARVGQAHRQNPDEYHRLIVEAMRAREAKKEEEEKVKALEKIEREGRPDTYYFGLFL